MVNVDNFNDDRPAGTLVFEGGKVFLCPATFEGDTKALTTSLFEGYGVKPDILIPAVDPAVWAMIPERLKSGFPMEDERAFVYRFDPKPLTAEIPEGELGRLDPRKLKDNIMKMGGKLVSLRELAMIFAISRDLMAKDRSRR